MAAVQRRVVAVPSSIWRLAAALSLLSLHLCPTAPPKAPSRLPCALVWCTAYARTQFRAYLRGAINSRLDLAWPVQYHADFLRMMHASTGCRCCSSEIASASMQTLSGSSRTLAAGAGAIMQMTRCAALDSAKWGVRVNAVCPGASRCSTHLADAASNLSAP